MKQQQEVILRSKYLEFRLVPVDNGPAKTDIWEVLNKNSEVRLGQIRWYGAWRQYCYFPRRETVMSSECLDDITTFIKNLMQARKK